MGSHFEGFKILKRMRYGDFVQPFLVMLWSKEVFEAGYFGHFHVSED